MRRVLIALLALPLFVLGAPVHADEGSLSGKVIVLDPGQAHTT